jgi:dihydropyrimidinase
MSTLIKNGTLITASDTFEADILIENETISLVGKNLTHPNAEVIEATGKLIMPGGIDPHVHLDLPMFDTVSSESRDRLFLPHESESFQ